MFGKHRSCWTIDIIHKPEVNFYKLLLKSYVILYAFASVGMIKHLHTLDISSSESRKISSEKIKRVFWSTLQNNNYNNNTWTAIIQYEGEEPLCAECG